MLHGLWAALIALLMAPEHRCRAGHSKLDCESTTALPEIHVIATTPVAPPPHDPDRAAGATRLVSCCSCRVAENYRETPYLARSTRTKSHPTSRQLELPLSTYARTPDLLQSMVRALPGVSLSDQTGNQFQLDLNYRGFIASPVIGTPQGLAVYQNGVRINEVFGDIVNWDFIPQNAINQLTLVPSNPVFGLNAIGGALVVRDEEWLHLSWCRRRSQRRIVRAR